LAVFPQSCDGHVIAHSRAKKDMFPGKEFSLKTSKIFSAFVVLLALPLFVCVPRSAKADSYTLANLGSDQGHFFVYGMSSNGDLAARVSDDRCTGQSFGQYGFCTGTIVHGMFANYSTTIPSFVSGDNTSANPFTSDTGTPCAYSILGYAAHAVCNNGRVAFQTWVFTPEHRGDGLYVATDDGISLVYGQSEGLLFLNSEGDIYFDNPFSDHYFEAFHVAQTPEPSTWMLLGTGLLGFGSLLRRRLS